MADRFGMVIGMAMVAALAACAGIDPQHVGNGQYLQILAGTDVVLETDTSALGLLNCSDSAYLAMQIDASLKGRLRCAGSPATSPLPYSYKARSTQTVAADHVLQSSPSLVRAKTSQLCRASLASSRADSKVEILEDHCAGQVQTGQAADGGAAQAPPAARYFAMRHEGKLVTQVDMANGDQCQELLDATAKEAAGNAAMKAMAFDCTAQSQATGLSFRAVLRDQLYDTPHEVATLTQQLCDLSVAQLMKSVTPQINQPRFAVVRACARP